MNLKKIISIFVFVVIVVPSICFAKSAREIDASVDTALSRFQQEVPGAKQLMDNSKGMLVFPSVIKAGIGIGGEYGTGALLQKSTKQKEYYNIVSGSFGFQLGGQVRTVYMLFMNEQALAGFRSSEGWKAGVDGSVAIVNVGANGQVDTATTNQPIIAFVLGQKGLMYNLTLEGSKFNRIYPEQ